MDEAEASAGETARKSVLPSWAGAALISLLWPGYGLLLSYAIVFIDLDLNLFDWSPTIDGTSYLIFGGATVLLAVSYPLAHFTRGKVPTGVAVLVTLALIVMGLLLLPAEALNPNTLLGRDAASPLWYRAGRVAVLALPGLVLALRFLRGRKGAADSPGTVLPEGP